MIQNEPGRHEDVLKSDEISIERKRFMFDLKENPRGRFLRITEDVNGRRDTIIIPSTGLAEFRRVLDGMVAAEDEFSVDGNDESPDRDVETRAA
ncbi:MAG: PUR family DNA/RNA-binding protein [Verrucomicrobiota bacterium]